MPGIERQSYLDEACGDDKGLRERIEELLVANEGGEGGIDPGETQFTANEDWNVSNGDEIGPYRLLQKLGEGGFGYVYLAEQRQPIERKVAIKIIKPGMDSKAVVARFEGERQALAMMDHPNIARVFDGGTSEKDQRPYFVMEFVQGIPITDYCDDHLLSTQDRLELFTSVCNAVHHAHQKGIIHRDIKPGNVMVTSHDGKPIVKVIDFGIAKALHHRLTDKTLFTQLGSMVGTPQYMSPEQADMTGMDVDTRSDVYSLSVLLYELVTGTTPLESNKLRTAGVQEMRRMICEEEPPRPSLRLSTSADKLRVLAKHRGMSPDKLSNEIRGDLDWIIMKGLEKDRSRRYDSASALAADINRALNHQPVLASPPSLLYRTRKFVRRNRGRLAFLSACFAILAVVTLGIINHWQHQNAAMQKEIERLNDAVDEANAALVAATASPELNELWEATNFKVSQIQESLEEFTISRPSSLRAKAFLERYERAQLDRDFVFSMEELLVDKSTDATIQGLKKMESGLRLILQNRGFDIEAIPADKLGIQMQADHSPVKLTDAIELWLSTRMKLSDAGSTEISPDEIEHWNEAMCFADPHPLRTAIRNTIFRNSPPGRSLLDNAVGEADLTNVCARKLSWLSDAYFQLGDSKRSAEIRDFALTLHSDDLMLNFEYAMRLLDQEKFGDAVRHLMRCTAIRPGCAGVWKNLAIALAKNGELLRAQRAIEKAIELEPGDSESKLLLARWFLDDSRPLEAIGSARAALSQDPMLHSAWVVIGRANMKLGKHAQALVAFEKFKDATTESNEAMIDDWIKECRQQIALE